MMKGRQLFELSAQFGTFWNEPCIIIKATASECQIQNDDRECMNQKNCHGVSQIKRSVKKIRNTIQSTTKEYHIQNGLQCESTAIDYRIRNDSK